MNKKNKILLGIALTSGVVASFSTAYALYENKTNASDFSIGIGSIASHTDSKDNVTYKFGEIKTYSNEGLTTELGTTKLSPKQNKVYIKVPLSFEYGETQTTSPQNSALGRFSVTVDIENKLAYCGAKVSAQLKGYSKGKGDDGDDGSLQETYFTTNKMIDFFGTTYSYQKDGNTVGNINDVESGYTSVTKFIDTAVDAKNIYCVITIDFSSGLKDDCFFDLADITNAYKVTLNWGQYKDTYSDFDSDLIPTAYVRGDLSSWKDLADYQMVPNINKAYNIVEWEYKLLKGFSKIKVHDSRETTLSSTWIPCRGFDNGAGVSKDSVGNAILDKSKSYHIYYTRNETYSNKQGFYVGLEEDSNSSKTSE